MRKIIIAIDGYSSSGKSSFAKNIAKKYGYIFIDTGAMYRAVTYYAMQNGLVDSHGSVYEDKLIENLPNIKITFRYDPVTEASSIFLNGVKIDEEIRSVDVSDKVAVVSSIPQVRERLVALQREMGRDKGIVMDGRDIGTVVFPDADLKIFMTADPEIRAMRRYRELSQAGKKVSLEEITQNILKRDNADITRTVGPLKKAEDALLLDNSRMSLEQQMLWVSEKIDKLIK
ncbi:MAG: (d)CMP kinase [Rikenellaceae bacterium]|nr:(d)CMP kinase [Rikenellaceae bacterium]